MVSQGRLVRVTVSAEVKLAEAGGQPLANAPYGWPGWLGWQRLQGRRSRAAATAPDGQSPLILWWEPPGIVLR